jgi:hypothetical protein
MAAPAVVIRLEIEASPVVYIDASNEGEARRIADWINAHPNLLRLVKQAEHLQQAPAP